MTRTFLVGGDRDADVARPQPAARRDLGKTTAELSPAAYRRGHGANYQGRDNSR